MPTPEQETLDACRRAGRSGSFSISERAHASARALGHSAADLRHALAQAARAERSAPPEGRWTVLGPSLDGTEVTLSIVLADGSLSVV